ncbi:uncharacterized protein LACBIDRAFT_332984 [Laccaria bicolor S238N-H82]|uniref:Predicted protein n=1 Tax=Laccaria bicolor (strain S238N-H82 / ATCC MYA-4686) TaxID=486041 RepID=B0DUG2_LACBS|nr:uncharacterized protein LACBIDRAFT_332984 [Laccaria bicolor S238N-H82]EDR01800.1 predicted protein [Laccaria bicolor S238N-H82]|eukprot:XP_001887613.1 predicted protein [Laccaria bicolor S238N-H82]
MEGGAPLGLSLLVSIQAVIFVGGQSPLFVGGCKCSWVARPRLVRGRSWTFARVVVDIRGSSWLLVGARGCWWALAVVGGRPWAFIFVRGPPPTPSSIVVFIFRAVVVVCQAKQRRRTTTSVVVRRPVATSQLAMWHLIGVRREKAGVVTAYQAGYGTTSSPSSSPAVDLLRCLGAPWVYVDVEVQDHALITLTKILRLQNPEK